MHWTLWYNWGKVHYDALQPLVHRRCVNVATVHWSLWYTGITLHCSPRYSFWYTHAHGKVHCCSRDNCIVAVAVATGIEVFGTHAVKYNAAQVINCTIIALGTMQHTIDTGTAHT